MPATSLPWQGPRSAANSGGLGGPRMADRRRPGSRSEGMGPMTSDRARTAVTLLAGGLTAVSVAALWTERPSRPASAADGMEGGHRG